MPRFSTFTFLAPKSDSNAAECEDALSVNAGRLRFCIADGATEGFASRRWARLLVKHWTRSERPVLTREQLCGWVAALGSRFDRYWQRRVLPWFAEEKARSGAFAAFVCLVFLESQGQWHWQAIAIGDSCLVVLRHEAIVASFPLDDPEAFGFRPVLLPSDQAVQLKTMEQIEVISAPAASGDTFFLLTDAVAAWFLRCAKCAPDEIARLEYLLQCGNHKALCDFIDKQRSNNRLRNDDVGIIMVRMDS